MTLRGTRQIFRVLAAATCAGALALGVVPAQAESFSGRDPADAPGSLGDIRRVFADHSDKRVRVRVRVADLRPTSDAGPSGMRIYVDTSDARFGPEFVITTGMQEGSDYQLSRMRRWRIASEPLGCRHAVFLDFDGDAVRSTMGRRCLGNPVQVRVGVRMDDHYDGSHPIRDWFKGRRHLSRWLAVG